jgi:diacylglycerol kinase (ATP)
MNRRIVYFVNPISGGKNKENLIKKLEIAHKHQAISYEVIHTNKEGNYHFLKQKIAEENVTDIVICGGDGTVSQICSYLIDEPVKVGIIPLGSGNGLALTAKISTNIDQALAIIFIDSFFINSTFSCHLCGLGLDAKVAHDFASQPGRGLKNYILTTIGNFFSSKTYTFTLNSKGLQYTVDAFFISVANSNQFGNNFTISPKASLQDGLLDIIVVKKMNKLKLIFSVFRHIKMGSVSELDEKVLNKDGIQYFQTNKLTITNNQLAPLHIDGDPATTQNRFTIQVVPRAINLLQPL